MAARLGKVPSELNGVTTYELLYLLHWLRKVEADREDRLLYSLGRVLGTIWEKEDFSSEGKSTKKTDTITFTLADLLSTKDFRKFIKSKFMSGQDTFEGRNPDMEVEMLDERYTPEMFKQLIGAFNLDGRVNIPKPGNDVK